MQRQRQGQRINDTSPCKGQGHDYQMVTMPFHKRAQATSISTIDSTTDSSIAYATLYCKRCGETLEIIAADYRYKKEESKVA